MSALVHMIENCEVTAHHLYMEWESSTEAVGRQVGVERKRLSTQESFVSLFVDLAQTCCVYRCGVDCVLHGMQLVNIILDSGVGQAQGKKRERYIYIVVTCAVLRSNLFFFQGCLSVLVVISFGRKV